MLNRLRTSPRLLAFLCGWLSVAALPPFNFFPVLFLSLSGLLFLINAAPNRRRAFQCGYAFGFAFFAFGLSWIGNALLIEAQTFGWLYPVVWLASGAFFGLFIAFPAALAYRFHPLVSRWLAFPALWVVFEWLRSFVLTGFPWNLLGSVLSFSDTLLQGASWGGTYFLSLLVLYGCSAPIFWMIQPTRRRLLISLTIPLVIFGSLFLYGTWRLSAADLTPSETIVRLVQPAIPQTMKWNPQTLEDNLQSYIELSQTPTAHKIAFTVWGETASPFPLDMDPGHLEAVRQAVPAEGYLVTGMVRYRNDNGRFRPRNSLLVIDGTGKVRGTYDKAHLVPFGEYIPLRQYLPRWIRPVANAIGTFEAGPGPQSLSLPQQPSFGGLICYEVIFPHQIIDPANRPSWLINLTNDGWYGNSAGPYQHLVAARLRAVEEGITIARSANTGISALISPYGQVLGTVPLNQKAVLDIPLPALSQFSTTYSRYGNIITLILCFSNIFLAFYLTIRKLKA